MYNVSGAAVGQGLLLIGVSLSEPHTSELCGAITVYIYMYIYVRIPYVRMF